MDTYVFFYVQKFINKYKILSWKLSAAQVKVDPLKLESQNQAKNILLGLLISPIKNWSNSVQGFLSYDQTKRQTNRQTEIPTLYIYRCHLFFFKNHSRNILNPKKMLSFSTKTLNNFLFFSLYIINFQYLFLTQFNKISITG